MKLAATLLLVLVLSVLITEGEGKWPGGIEERRVMKREAVEKREVEADAAYVVPNPANWPFNGNQE